MRSKARRRVRLELSDATVIEALDCVETRLRWYRSRRVAPPAITEIAALMLREALER